MLESLRLYYGLSHALVSGGTLFLGTFPGLSPGTLALGSR